MITARRKAWKLKVENLNVQIINDNNFVQLNKYYSMYNNMDRRKLENVVVRNMILKDKHFDTIKGQIPEDLYNILMNRKSRIVEEEKQMRINMVKILCIVNMMRT